MQQDNPLCKVSLAQNSVLFFCIEHQPSDVLTGFNDWSRERGKHFDLTANETAIILRTFENILHASMEHLNMMKDIEMSHMSAKEIDVCLGK